MIDFKHGEIKHIMPYNLLGPETRAVSYALGRAMGRIQEFSMGIKLYADIAHVSDEVLNLMALELNTQYYDQTLPRKVREGLVAQAFLWHIRAGTPSVLTEYMATVLAGGYIEEWMEYGGEPYYFKAFARMFEDAVVPLGYGAEVRAQIDIYKNVRSWLESLTFILTTDFKVDIWTDTRLTIISGFYPRGNKAFLRLDSTWLLSGGKQLNGYVFNDIEFYPARLTMQSDAAGIFLSAAQTGIATAVAVVLESNAGIGIGSDVDATVNRASRITFPAAAEIKINTQNHLRAEHDLWYLDGSYRLDGGKLLDAYIVDYDL